MVCKLADPMLGFARQHTATVKWSGNKLVQGVDCVDWLPGTTVMIAAGSGYI
jgi:hypothetical protein